MALARPPLDLRGCLCTSQTHSPWRSLCFVLLYPLYFWSYFKSFPAIREGVKSQGTGATEMQTALTPSFPKDTIHVQPEALYLKPPVATRVQTWVSPKGLTPGGRFCG